MTRIGVVVNPTAGHGRGADHGRRAVAEFHAAGLDTVDLSGDDASAALARARASLERIDALVVVGGDGMAHLGVNATAGTGVPLGLVPAGSGNDLARCLGLAIDDIPAAVRMIAGALDPPLRTIDAIATSSPNLDGVQPVWTVCVLSAGIDAAVNARANTYSWPQGHGRYVRGVVAELAAFTPYGYRIVIDGEELTQSATLVALANAPSFGGGLKIAPGAVMDDGLMEVVIADALRRHQIVRLFPKLYQGTHVTHPAVTIRRARVVTIEPGDVPTPTAFGDGEELAQLPLTARIVPHAVGLLAPRLP